MMKYLLKSLSFLTLVVIVSTTIIFAQVEDQEPDNPISKAQEDYLFQYSNYNEAHETYVTAKETYQKFKTIKSQQEAIEASKKILDLRAEVYRAYLQLLKIKLLAQPHLDPGLKDSQFGKLEATQAFLETHKTNVATVKSVIEVNSESQRLERESPAIINLAYESLSLILIGQAQGLEVNTRLLLEETIAQENLIDNPGVQQGISQVRKNLASVRLNVDRAGLELQKIGSSLRTKADEVYSDVKKEMSIAKGTLSESVRLIEDIKREASDD